MRRPCTRHPPTLPFGRTYRTALGRTPTAGELEVARGLVGTPAKPEGVADLLWAHVMLPEFQVIY